MSYDDQRNTVGRQPVRVLELDLDFCDLEYGVAPCVAITPIAFSYALNNLNIFRELFNFRQSAAQIFTIDRNISLQKVIFSVNKSGSPFGGIKATIYSDSSGAPGGALAQSSLLSITTINDGTSTVEFFIDIDLTPGTYHVAIEVGATYLASYVAGVDFISIGGDTSPVSEPLGKRFNGVSWINDNIAVVYEAYTDEPTGTRKCYNTFQTCQDTANYTASPKTYVFSESISDMPLGINMIPCIKSVSSAPTEISIDGGLGSRETVTITVKDFPWPDRWIGMDKYVSGRAFDTENTGTFWGKFLARNRQYNGRPARMRYGYVTNPWDWDNFETRAYVIDQINGPDANGNVKITLKDPLILSIDKKAQAPRPSTGQLLAAITDVQTTLTLQPVGVGDLEYPAAGKLRIGSEIITYATRVSDVFSGLTRGSNNTDPKSHSIDDNAQLCKEYTNQKVNDIVYDLLVNFTTIDASLIDAAAWQLETDEWLDNDYSTLLTAPLGVNKLIKELNEQAGFYIWWDQREQTIKLKAIKPSSSTDVVFNDDTFVENSMSVKEETKKRLSQVWFYFGRFDPTKRIDETENYQRLFVDIDPISESTDSYGEPSIKKIFSRWISSLQEDSVLDATSRYLSIFAFPPRIIKAKIDPKDIDVWSGDNVQVQTRILQDDTGANLSIPMIVQEVKEAQDILTYTMFENNFTIRDPGEPRLMVIDASQNDFNLKDQYDLIFGTTFGSVILNVTINPGVIIGSTSALSPAFFVDGFPTGSTITILNNGRIQGRGGQGGIGGVFDGQIPPHLAANGQTGGTAFETNQSLSFDNLNGAIWSGGGGGGGGNASGNQPGATPIIGSPRTFKPGGGGGGAGSVGGLGNVSNGYRSVYLGGFTRNFPEAGNPGLQGTDAVGGAGGIGPIEEHFNISSGDGGQGGAPGLVGLDGTGLFDTPSFGTVVTQPQGGGTGGAPGNSVEGDSNITWVNFGSRLGPII